MKASIVPEIMQGEMRCAISDKEIPQAKASFAKDGFLVGKGTGVKSNISDLMFEQAGALIVPPEVAWQADVVAKVKQPLPEEYKYIKRNPNIILATFMHLPGNPELKSFCSRNRLRFIAYENLILANGRRPVLAAMSERAALFSVSFGAEILRAQKHILMDDVKALIIGHRGVMGWKAYTTLQNMGAKVIGIDAKECGGKYLNAGIDHWIKQVNLVICGAAAPNKPAPKLVFMDMLEDINDQSIVIIDVAIDEGGQCDFSQKTSHENPTVEILTPRNQKKIIYCGIPNQPGAVGPSSTPRIAKEVAEHVFPLLAEIDKNGWDKAVRENPILERASEF